MNIGRYKAPGKEEGERFTKAAYLGRHVDAAQDELARIVVPEGWTLARAVKSYLDAHSPISLAQARAMWSRNQEERRAYVNPSLSCPF